SAMVIPRFYINDNDAPQPCTRSAPEHPAAGESPSIAPQLSLHPPPAVEVRTSQTRFPSASSGLRLTGSADAPPGELSRKTAGEGPRDGPANAVTEQTLGWHESEIITNLFLGDLQDAGRFDGMIISVLPDAMPAEPKRTIRLPFLANGRATLDSTSAL